MEIGRWGSHVFEVSASLIRGFSDVSIEGSVETDTKKDGKAQYVAVKEYKPKTQKITVHLRSATGCDVRNEAMSFVDDIGKADYFYIGGKKLFTCQMMLTQAEISNVEMNGLVTWTNADVTCTFTQSSKDDGGTTVTKSSSSGGGKTPQKSTSTILDKVKEAAKKAVKTTGTLTDEKKTAIKSAADYIASVVNKAKSATTTKAANKTAVGALASTTKFKIALKK